MHNRATMSNPTSRELFEYWLADMDDALARFTQRLPRDVAEKLDYSAASLDVLESWLLAHYPDIPSMRPESEADLVDGMARYVGETFRKHLGGRWDIELENPKYAYFGIPQLIGFWNNSTPVAPRTLVTTAADRRTGISIGRQLATYLRKRPAS